LTSRYRDSLYTILLTIAVLTRLKEQTAKKMIIAVE